MGGILMAAGVDGFMENHDKLLASADEEQAELSAFLEALAPHAAEAIPASRIVELSTVGVTPPLAENLPDYLQGVRDDELRRRLPSYLRKNEGRVASDWRLEYVTARRRGWQVAPAAAPAQHDRSRN